MALIAAFSTGCSDDGGTGPNGAPNIGLDGEDVLCGSLNESQLRAIAAYYEGRTYYWIEDGFTCFDSDLDMDVDHYRGRIAIGESSLAIHQPSAGSCEDNDALVFGGVRRRTCTRR